MAKQTPAPRPIQEPEEAPKSAAVLEQEKLVQMRNEKSRLEKEIDLLRVKYDNQQRAMQELGKQYQDQWRVDRDKIDRQLADNKAKEDRLIKTQSEVNQLRAACEADAAKQKDLLLQKEVALDKAHEEVKAMRAVLAARLAKIK